MSRAKIFYSWQSYSNSTNRGFIGKALEVAVKSIARDDSIEIEPVVDRDTLGEPGAPDIAHTIFQKIEQAEVFVGDVSTVIGQGSDRISPNPNVLIELGYAIKALEMKRILLVMNTALGKPDSLPFDLRGKRIITYEMPECSEDRSNERKLLANKLEQALRAILSNTDLRAKDFEPRLRLEVGNSNNRALQGQSPIFNTMIHAPHSPNELPDAFENTGLLGHLSVLDIYKNKDYWRDLADYILMTRACAGMAFAITNESNKLAKGVRIEVNHQIGLGLELLNDYEMSNYPRYDLTPSNYLAGLQLVDRDRIAPEIQTYDDHQTLTIVFGNVQPKATKWTDVDLFVRADESRSYPLAVKIYADNISPPQEVTIDLNFSVQHRPPLKIEDVASVDAQRG